MTSIASDLAAAKKILLVRLRSLGDSILSLPLIDALHAWRPELKIDVLIEAPFAVVFSHHPAVHETLVLRPRGSQPGAGWSRLRALREIRCRGYDVAMNLHGGSTSLWLTAASGAGRRIGQATHRQSWIYSARIPPSSTVWGRGGLHTVEHQLTPLRWLGLPLPETPVLRLHPDPAIAASAVRRLELAGLSPGSYVVIHPAATLETKQWPPERFASVGDALAADEQVRVVFAAGPGEVSVLSRVEKASQMKHEFWCDLDLSSLFWIIINSRLFVGNDSGPTHAAAGLGKPIVVVWGSSDFTAWRPWGTRYEAVRSDLPCMPCAGYSCAKFGSPRCILDISVERVIHACRRLLGE